MITVRFPSGQAVTYNSGTKVDRWFVGTNIRDSSDHLLAWVSDSSGAVIEWASPCKVENPFTELTMKTALQYVNTFAESYDHTWETKGMLVSLKKLLRKFHQQRRCWMK
jgi:hypothetical protein